MVFLSILILFLFSKVGGAAVLEEKYAKQIALMIDSAESEMEIHLSMEDAIEKAADEGWEGNIVKINGNIVLVKLREKGGYEYSFFNDVDANAYLDTKNNKEYVIMVTKNK